MSGEEELWTLNHAIEFLAYRDPQRVSEAPVYISERDWRPETVLAYLEPKVIAAIGTLWRKLEDGIVTAIDEDGYPIPPTRWAVNSLRQRGHPDEQIGLGPFIREVQRVVGHVRIRAAELARPTELAQTTEPDAPEPAVVRKLTFDALVALLRRLKREGTVKNREGVKAAALEHFGQKIPAKLLLEARWEVGLAGRPGRPKAQK